MKNKNNEKFLKNQNDIWESYKEVIATIPSYLILQKASDIVFDYVDTKRPVTISWFDTADDFIILWQKLEQISNDLDKLATIDKALQTIRDIKEE